MPDFTPRTRRPWKQPTAFDRLTTGQLAEVQDWFLNEGLSYPKAQARILQRFNVPISRAAIYNYFHRAIEPLIIQRARECQPLTLEICYMVKRDQRVIGEHKTVLSLTKDNVTTQTASLPPAVQQAITTALN